MKMKKIIALLLTLIMLFGIAACSDVKKPAATDTEVTDSGTQSDTPDFEPPAVGSYERRYCFMRKDYNGSEYTPVSAIFIDNYEDIDMDICFGYIDDNGEPVVVSAAFEVRNMLSDDPIDSVRVDPCNTSTERCKVYVCTGDFKHHASIVCYPDGIEDAGSVAALPIIPVGEVASRVYNSNARFFMKNDEGGYSAIDYISPNERITTMTIAYGTIEDGSVQLYDSKFWARNFEELNGSLTVIPTGTAVKECIVVINTEKQLNGAYVYCEQDNVSGVIQTALPVIVNYQP